jgi:hypothetical protein
VIADLRTRDDISAKQASDILAAAAEVEGQLGLLSPPPPEDPTSTSTETGDEHPAKGKGKGKH